MTETTIPASPVGMIIKPEAEGARCSARRSTTCRAPPTRGVHEHHLRGAVLPAEPASVRGSAGRGGRHRKLVATFGPELAAYTEAINRALNNPDPWRGFCHYLITITAMQRGDRGFRDILTQAFPAAPELRAQRDRVYRGVVELIEKAKATGRLRAVGWVWPLGRVT